MVLWAYERPDTTVMQTVIQINIYRFDAGRFEYLLLKRIDEDDKFWQPVTLPVPSHGTIAETLRRAAREQVGLRGFKQLSKEMYSYEWYAHGERGRDIVFAAELSPRTAVEHDTHHYNDHAWLPCAEAVARLKWNGNKEALRQLDGHLRQEYDEHPGAFQDLPRQRPAGAPSQAQQPEQPFAVAEKETETASRKLAPPSASGRARRLPDKPEPLPGQDEEEPSVGEIFLKL